LCESCGGSGSYTSFIYMARAFEPRFSQVPTAWSRDWDIPGHDHRADRPYWLAPGRTDQLCSVTTTDTLSMRFTRPMHRQSCSGGTWRVFGKGRSLYFRRVLSGLASSQANGLARCQRSLLCPGPALFWASPTSEAPPILPCVFSHGGLLPTRTPRRSSSPRVHRPVTAARRRG